MTLSAWGRNEIPLLKADSTIRLLDDDQDGADSDHYEDMSRSVYNYGTVAPNYSCLRRTALAISFIAWILMAIPMAFWLSLPFLMIR